MALHARAAIAKGVAVGAQVKGGGLRGPAHPVGSSGRWWIGREARQGSGRCSEEKGRGEVKAGWTCACRAT